MYQTHVIQGVNTPNVERNVICHVGKNLTQLETRD